MDRAFNLSGLRKLLHDTLLTTEQVKEMLRKNCEEAAFALKPWPVKIVEKREDECTCNCKKVAVESEVEEIAAGIDMAITLAQDLREQVKLDVAFQKRPSKKNPLGKASLSPAAPGSSGRRNILHTNVMTQKANIAKSVDSRRSSAACQSGAVASVAPRNISEKKQSRASPAKSIAKPKSERNFILENKLNVKKIIALNKPQADARGSNNAPPQTSRTSLSPAALTPELNSLIHKMAQKFTEGALASSSDDSKTNNCPLHDNNQFVDTVCRTVMINAAEALRHFKVPSEIVKTLEATHAFLEKTDARNPNVIGEDKAERSIGNFLKEFEAMNTSVRESLREASPLIEVTHESISLLGDIFTGKLDPMQLNDVRKWIKKSEAISKPYNTENLTEDHHIIEKPSCDISFPLTREWMSNGVWNVSCVKQFKCFSEANCITYSDERQLLALYEAMQKLQRTKYLNALIQTVLRDVIPAIKSHMDPASAEYARAYKTMLILCQGLNPQVPVLVKTDS
ncbi:uncharacterized protein LOC105182388 [Harpegnathos saltator]|uniref:Uncharacterized protein n=1 Tax=Harpegnathos saltator TaxID=610380 RepID=E2BG02_HARSA|nr:uncharacterized protein LOC105182388 [Harpegnathos saltator]EFN85404.1 hypothetical protein EAI_14619 [Harpegnathos saltator]